MRTERVVNCRLAVWHTRKMARICKMTAACPGSVQWFVGKKRKNRIIQHDEGFSDGSFTCLSMYYIPHTTLPLLTGAVFFHLETTHAPSFPALPALVVEAAAAAAIAEGAVGVATG